MRWMVFVLVAGVALAGVVASMAPASGQAGQEAAPIFVTDIPPGYRDWRLISVAHEAGDLNDIRAILGNDVAIKAYREGTRPFPDGTIIARLAWSYDPSEENNRAFGRPQSFVAGPPKNGVQFMVKDASKYASTGGWGFAHFDDGKPADAAVLDRLLSCSDRNDVADPVEVDQAAKGRSEIGKRDLDFARCGPPRPLQHEAQRRGVDRLHAGQIDDHRTLVEKGRAIVEQGRDLVVGEITR